MVSHPGRFPDLFRSCDVANSCHGSEKVGIYEYFGSTNDLEKSRTNVSEPVQGREMTEKCSLGDAMLGLLWTLTLGLDKLKFENPPTVPNPSSASSQVTQLSRHCRLWLGLLHYGATRTVSGDDNNPSGWSGLSHRASRFCVTLSARHSSSLLTFISGYFVR